MRISRRRLLRLASALPVGMALVPLAAIYARALAGAAAQIRPAPMGTSATRCAACGAPDHAMLDATCPAHPRVARSRVR